MKKKNRVLALVALLSATFAMALTSPMAANAAGFEETYVGEKRSESNLYGGMIMPQTTVAISTETGYTLDTTEEPNADTGRIYYLKNSHGDVIGQMDENGNLLPDDVRLTTFGKKLRSTSLDELPELLNILRGDMSIVGPRPLLVKYLPLYSEEQRHRHDVRPGLTGWAQVNGRNTVKWEEKFQLDLWYVQNVSLMLDLRIILMTVKSVLHREGISSETTATMEEFTGTKENTR